jgi:hypothetical protein
MKEEMKSVFSVMERKNESQIESIIKIAQISSFYFLGKKTLYMYAAKYTYIKY